MGNIIKYHNDINLIKLGGMTEREIDIFFSLLFKLQKEKTDTIIIEFKELLKLEESSNKSHQRLIGSILKMNKKLIQLNQTVKTERGYMTFNLFRTLEIREDTKELRVSINEDFKFMLNDLLKNFTYFDLKELVTLKSSYSKNCYKLLRQFRGNNFYNIKLSDFEELLGVPEGYKTRHLNDRVLTPILKELTPIFKDLKLEKKTNKGESVGRGRKTETLYFSWKDTPKAIRKTLEENVRAKQDKERIEGDIRAKKKIKATEELIKSNKKELTPLEEEKNKLCLKLLQNNKKEILVEALNIESLEELKEFKKKHFTTD
jgi:plasmid replication initiation protein